MSRTDTAVRDGGSDLRSPTAASRDYTGPHRDPRAGHRPLFGDLLRSCTRIRPGWSPPCSARFARLRRSIGLQSSPKRLGVGGSANERKARVAWIRGSPTVWRPAAAWTRLGVRTVAALLG